MSLPVLRIQKKHVAAIAAGCPWVMRHEAVESSQWMTLAPGELVRVEGERGDFIGIGMANPLSHIVCRMLSAREEIIDEAFFAARFERSLAKREALYDAPYYRLVHAEADQLPGLIIDRFDGVMVVQVGSAGMERLQPIWMRALEKIIPFSALVLRNDFSSRKLEGLEQFVRIERGEITGPIAVRENGCTYFADVLAGQKTGWFYDMCDNRRRVAALASGARMLDVFSHSGGFGLLAAKSGPKSVTMVDASDLALSLAMRAAAENSVADLCETIKGDAVLVMKELAARGERYEVVVADPPAYVKTRQDIASGMKGYAKVAEHAAALVAEGGVFFTATCSHHASRGAFNKAVLEGIARAGRKAEIIAHTGASADHPLHRKLPQSEYLKGLLLRIL